MTTDQITPAEKADSDFFPEFREGRGWGFGPIITRRDNLFATPRRYGWDGDHGKSCYTDFKAIPLTQRLRILPVDRSTGPSMIETLR